MNRLTIYPAIDLKDGKCVRLRQGRAEDATVYGDDPVEMAQRWRDQGATALHVVDLDGAFEGRPRHAATIAAIVARIGVPVQVGGGLRTDADVEAMLGAGAARAIIGTRALGDEAALRLLAERFGSRLAVGIDARDGRVQVKGWVETTNVNAADLARKVALAGIETIIYTDTATDGMLAGPNLAALERICRAASCQVIASGGISQPEHVASLRRLQCPNLAGAIVGKALYEGRTTLAALMAAA